MTDETNHARQRPHKPHNPQKAQNPQKTQNQPDSQEPEPKDPASLPGPNRQYDRARYGEALAPGTIPDEEREKLERQEPGKPKGGVERP